jgi:hypothetical protein
MSFAARDLRPGKDVFAVDGAYLGTVIWLVTDGAVRLPRSRARERDVGTVDICVGPRLGGEGSPSAFSGEAIGPMPTSDLGNTGPSSQSPSTAYATSPKRLDATDTRQPTALVVVRLLTSLNWSTLRPRVWRIPVSLVQAASHERIVLAVTESEVG